MNLKEKEFRLSVSMAGGGGLFARAHTCIGSASVCRLDFFFSPPLFISVPNARGKKDTRQPWKQ